MKPFLDSSFLAALLFETDDSATVWGIMRRIHGPALVTSFQILNTENRLRRQLEAEGSSAEAKSLAAGALQNFRWYVDQQVFLPVVIDYDIAIRLAYSWQRRMNDIPPTLVFLWPAFAITSGSTHFLSIDARTRALAKAGGLELLPERL